MSGVDGMERYRALGERHVRCTCGSTAVIANEYHEPTCARRIFREATDEVDSLRHQLRGAVEALEEIERRLRGVFGMSDDDAVIILECRMRAERTFAQLGSGSQ